ncbi:MAG: flagellar M-ring protein FliF, partial [Candidatus Cloacimonetes bacterium]|nr:flagellar M-ring protein FliF [Candidatus Cloacimonadota bacterium]
MKGYFTQFTEKLREVYSRLDLRQKIVLAALLIMTVSVFIWLLSWSARDEYALLFGNLEPKQASEAIDKLEEMKIGYKLENSGKSIYIAKDKVYSTRIKLSSEGIGGRGGTGFEIFDKSNLGVTERVQEINFQRAMEGELQRTIESINGVELARVHLVFPEQRLFVEDQQNPSASIFLSLTTTLTKNQIEGIANLTASAVEG